MTHLVDLHVGKMIRQRRWLVGMTQQQLAQIVGIKFQQIQKYEAGTNRVSASRLWDISLALNVSVASFFAGLKPEVPTFLDIPEQLPETVLEDKEAMDLIRSYYAIPAPERRRLFDLARVLRDAA
ncbi:helix-turn-helix transcriptional regulator [uncultured Sulfitobacter sp.]|uniref:helix-turn-helix domain-containing protein n=1 Tax=uncultured Sulfitobacter sp. TaxID=191468 RepID=UPI0026098C52|nr:helix-turn-helix transcriptional regulator [uncultured Sulfitobacter sp.]